MRRPQRSLGAGLAVAGLVALLLAVPPSAATPPSLPGEARAMLEGVPAVGEEVVLDVEFTLRGTPDLVVRLHASPLVEILGEATVELPGSQGRVLPQAWRLRATGEGFWSLALSATTKDGGEPYGLGGPCCGYGWSSQDGGDWDPYPMEPFRELPATDGQGFVEASVREGRVHLSYHVTAASWLETAELHPQLGEGSIFADHSRRAVSLDAVAWETDVDVPDGGTLLAYAAATYFLAFPEPVGLPEIGHTAVRHSLTGEVHCENLRVAREGDQAWVEDRWACTQAANTLHGVPAVGPGLLAALLASSAVLLRRRVKG